MFEKFTWGSFNILAYRKLIRTILKNKLFKDSTYTLFSRIISLILQIAYFTIITRSLGVDQYGAFASILSITKILNPFSSWGSAEILVKNVSRNRGEFNECWGNALFITLLLGLLLTYFVNASSRLFLPQITLPFIILSISLSELLFDRISAISGYAFIAVHSIRVTVKIDIFRNLVRLVFAMFFFWNFGSYKINSLTEWSFFYLLSTLITMIICLSFTFYFLGNPRLNLSKFKSDALQGFFFSISLFALSVYSDIDKAMLASLSTLESAGIYAAAYRFIYIAFVPVHSLLMTCYADFFKHGAAGIQGSMNFAKRLVLPICAYGVAASTAFVFLAPWVPEVIGKEYKTSVEALYWLAPLPFFSSMHFLAADTLTGAGFQGIRSGIQLMVALFNVSLNFWLIPLYSWRGAAWASLASDAILALSLWGVVLFLRYRCNTETQPPNQFNKLQNERI